MTSRYLADEHEGPLKFQPGIEVHAFVRDAARNFVDVQCAGEERAYPFRRDQNGERWSDEVTVITEDASE